MENLFIKVVVIPLTLLLIMVGFKTITSDVSINLPAKSKIMASVARVDLTPPLEMKFALGGYGERMNKPAIGVHDKIWAKAVALKKEIRNMSLLP
jgi:hypothetical protein